MPLPFNANKSTAMCMCGCIAVRREQEKKARIVAIIEMIGCNEVVCVCARYEKQPRQIRQLITLLFSLVNMLFIIAFPNTTLFNIKLGRGAVMKFKHAFHFHWVQFRSEAMFVLLCSYVYICERCAEHVLMECAECCSRSASSECN